MHSKTDFSLRYADPHVLALLQRLVGVDRSPTVDADATRDGDGDENPNDDFNLDNGVDEEDDHPDDCISVDDADEDEQPTTSTPPTPAPPPPANGRKRKSEAMPSERPHAAVERHYRSVLKSKLDLLHAQVPASGTFSLTPSPDSGVANQQAVTKSEPKSVILDRAVRYVNHLVSTYEQYEREHTMLRQQLQAYIAN